MLLLWALFMIIIFAIEISLKLRDRKKAKKNREENKLKQPAPVQPPVYAPSTVKSDLPIVETEKSKEEEHNDNPSENKYQYSNDKIKESFLPKELVPLLPDADLITITGITADQKTFGRVYLGPDYKKDLLVPLIVYAPRYVANNIKQAEICRLTFMKTIHPFLRIYTDDINSCAGKLYSSLNRLSRIGITKDRIWAEFTDNGICDNNWYTETPDYIKYYNSYAESYHDGGGSGSYEWWLYGTTDISVGQELQQNKYLENRIVKGFLLPDHNGYWIENGHFYIVNPFGLRGIFEYYCKLTDQHDYDSSLEVFETGVPFRSKEKE